MGAHVRRKRGSSVPLATDVLSDLPECRNVKTENQKMNVPVLFFSMVFHSTSAAGM